MTPREAMAELPNRADYVTPGDRVPHDSDNCLCVRCARFYRDSAAAWQMRCLAAVEALQGERSSLTAERIGELCLRMEDLREGAEHASTIIIANDAYIALAELYKQRIRADEALKAIGPLPP